MEMTFTVPDELAPRIQALKPEFSRILQRIARDADTKQDAVFEGLSAVVETLAALPTPQEVLALRPSAELQARISELLEKNRSTGLLPAEQDEWRRYMYLEHVVRMAKAEAAHRLGGVEAQ